MIPFLNLDLQLDHPVNENKKNVENCWDVCFTMRTNYTLRLQVLSAKLILSSTILTFCKHELVKNPMWSEAQ